MARLSRLAVDRHLHHLVHRALNDVDLLRSDADRADYLSALLDVSRGLDIAVHAYALLPDRVQLLLTPAQASGLSLMMQRVGRRYVGAYNRRHGRTGSPWDGRYRTAVLEPGEYLVATMRHVEQRPVDCGLVSRPEDWVASSAAHHLGLRVDPLVTDHQRFWALGNTPFEREANYRQLGERPLPGAVRCAIDEATERGWALGGEAFIQHLSTTQARPLLPRRRGRPSSRPTPRDPL